MLWVLGEVKWEDSVHCSIKRWWFPCVWRGLVAYSQNKRKTRLCLWDSSRKIWKAQKMGNLKMWWRTGCILSEAFFIRRRRKRKKQQRPGGGHPGGGWWIWQEHSLEREEDTDGALGANTQRDGEQKRAQGDGFRSCKSCSSPIYLVEALRSNHLPSPREDKPDSWRRIIRCLMNQEPWLNHNAKVSADSEASRPLFL